MAEFLRILAAIAVGFLFSIWLNGCSATPVADEFQHGDGQFLEDKS